MGMVIWGLPNFGPFDRIIVTAGAPFVPEPLKDQLKPGGLMVIPVGDTNNQVMTTVKKQNDSKIQNTEHGDFIFVPLLDNKAWG